MRQASPRSEVALRNALSRKLSFLQHPSALRADTVSSSGKPPTSATVLSRCALWSLEVKC